MKKNQSSSKIACFLPDSVRGPFRGWASGKPIIPDHRFLRTTQGRVGRISPCSTINRGACAERLRSACSLRHLRGSKTTQTRGPPCFATAAATFCKAEDEVRPLTFFSAFLHPLRYAGPRDKCQRLPAVFVSDPTLNADPPAFPAGRQSEATATPST